MTIPQLSLSKSQAEALLRQQNRIAKAVIYLRKLDRRMIYRMGKEDDNRIARIRYYEDGRPMTRTDKRTGQVISKRNEIITYKENNDLYVLEKSGGVSLFDAMSPKLSLGRSDCWYYVPQNAKIPDGILIAKDVEPDEYGHFHYSFQPGHNMKLSEFQEKLAEIGKQMRIV